MLNQNFLPVATKDEEDQDGIAFHRAMAEGGLVLGAAGAEVHRRERPAAGAATRRNE